MTENRAKSRWDQLHIKAIKCRTDHPEIYATFCSLANGLRGQGIEMYSANGILEYMRFRDTVRDKPFKINSHVGPFFARWYMDEYPEAEGFFRTRVQKSKYELPCDLPELEPENFIETEETLAFEGEDDE